MLPTHVLHDSLLIGVMRQLYIDKYQRRDLYGAPNSAEFLGIDPLGRHVLGAVGELFVALGLGEPVGVNGDHPVQWNALVSGGNTVLPEIDIIYGDRHIDVHATRWERGTDRNGMDVPDLILQDDDAENVEHVLVHVDQHGAPTIYGAVLEQDTRTERYFKRARDKGFVREAAVTPPRSIPYKELQPFEIQSEGLTDRAAKLDLHRLILEHGQDLPIPWDAFFVAYRSGIRSLETLKNVFTFRFWNGFHEGLRHHYKSTQNRVDAA